MHTHVPEKRHLPLLCEELSEDEFRSVSAGVVAACDQLLNALLRHPLVQCHCTQDHQREDLQWCKTTQLCNYVKALKPSLALMRRCSTVARMCTAYGALIVYFLPTDRVTVIDILNESSQGLFDVDSFRTQRRIKFRVFMMMKFRVQREGSNLQSCDISAITAQTMDLLHNGFQ